MSTIVETIQAIVQQELRVVADRRQNRLVVRLGQRQAEDDLVLGAQRRAVLVVVKATYDDGLVHVPLVKGQQHQVVHQANVVLVLAGNARGLPQHRVDPIVKLLKNILENDAGPRFMRPDS